MGGIAVEHRTRILWYRESMHGTAMCNEWNSRNNNRGRVRRTVRIQSWRFYYNCVCPRKSVGVPTLQLSDFALSLPSVYMNWRGIYFAELKLCGVHAVELMDEQHAHEREDRITERNLRAKHAFCDATCVFHIY